MRSISANLTQYVLCLYNAQFNLNLVHILLHEYTQQITEQCQVGKNINNELQSVIPNNIYLNFNNEPLHKN